jgi:hypothetical protein
MVDVAPRTGVGRRRIGSFVAGVAALTAAWSFGVEAASAWSHTIDLDQRHGISTLDQVSPEIQRTCQTSATVTLRVRAPSTTFATTFDCQKIRGEVRAITEQLVASAGEHNRASVKADRVLALQRELLPDVTFDRDEMVWGLAAGNGRGCQRAQRPEEIRTAMSAAAQATGETAEHWTTVEAVEIAGICPRQLGALFRNVSRNGQSAATATVRPLISDAIRRLGYR